MNLKFPKAISAGLAIAAALSLTLPAAATAQADQSVDIRADAVQLTGDALRNAFSGTTHNGAYGFGRNGIPHSTYVDIITKDGRVTLKKNGLEYPGRWTASYNFICFQYDNLENHNNCFEIYKMGNCYFYYSPNQLESPDPMTDIIWSGRSVIKGERPRCEPQVS